MTTYAFNNKRYRVTNNTKFILSSILITAFALSIAAAIIFITMNHVSTMQEARAIEAEQQQLEVLKEKYSFTINGTYVEATSAEQALEQTKQLLLQQMEKTQEQININQEQELTIAALQEKYDTKINEIKQVTKKDVQLYNEFSYAIEFPGSDVTLQDVKMIVDISNKENVNPHVWLSLVELESKYKSYSRSNRSSASGWGQVLSATGRYLYEDELKLGQYNHSKMGTNKEINAKMSIHYLSELIKDKGSVEKALVSYNGGELGTKYVDIVNKNLKENTGMTLSTIKKRDPI